MTKDEALKILIHHNKWRRGADKVLLNPTKIGKAIDVAIQELRKAVTNE